MGKSTGPSWSKVVQGAFLRRQNTAKRRPTWPSWSKLALLGPTWSKLVPYTLSHRTPRTPERRECGHDWQVAISAIGSSSECTEVAAPSFYGNGNLLERRKRLGWHVCRRKLPPKKFKIATKKGLKKCEEKIKKTIRNVSEQFKAPLRLLKKFSPALF